MTKSDKYFQLSKLKKLRHVVTVRPHITSSIDNQLSIDSIDQEHISIFTFIHQYQYYIGPDDCLVHLVSLSMTSQHMLPKSCF